MFTFFLLQEVGAAFFGALKGLLVAPLFYLGMVSAEEHIGHAPATEFGRTCILRRGHKAILEGVA